MAGIPSLTFQSTVTQNWTARGTTSGLAQGNQNVNQPSATVSWGTGVANNAAGGADELYWALLSLAPSASTTISLQALVDVLGTAAVSLARLKYARFKLLGSSETAPDGTVGTAASGVTVGNAATNPNLLFLSSAAPTFDLNQAGGFGQAVTFEDPGSAGIPVDATHLNVKVLNKDSGLTVKLLVTFLGGSN